eukprot:6177731-Pleurochrysis_carterae.AAC.3
MKRCARAVARDNAPAVICFAFAVRRLLRDCGGAERLALIPIAYKDRIVWRSVYVVSRLRMAANCLKHTARDRINCCEPALASLVTRWSDNIPQALGIDATIRAAYPFADARYAPS